MSYKIVVARYNENIEWLQPDIDNCIIYNKGTPLYCNNEILLDNIGRETHTYLYYILTNYNELPDIVLFTQGAISEHRRNGTLTYLYELKNEALLNGLSIPFGLDYESPLLDKKWNKNNSWFSTLNYKEANKTIDFDEWFIKHISKEYPAQLLYYPNALFAVKKEFILQHPIEYYQNLIEEVNYAVDPGEGHLFERAWYHIFSNKSNHIEKYTHLYYNNILIH
jgi:hypothetical protein